MPAQTDLEMQYKPAEPMAARQGEPSNASSETVTECEHKKKTVLGMRGGGLILDLCACFICCECMEGCCNAVDDCCCC